MREVGGLLTLTALTVYPCTIGDENAPSDQFICPAYPAPMSDITPAAPATPRKQRRRRSILIAVSVLVVLLIGAALWQRMNPFTIETQIEIDAPPDVVWQVLTDFDAYPEWNPALVGMSGDLEVGKTLRFSTDDTPDALTFEPVVREVRPGEHLRWEGQLLVPGLFDGEHFFDLELLPNGGTRLTQSEHFRGITVPFLSGWLGDNTHPDFIAMNEALRERAISVAATH
jgi:hypothetical protein